MKDAWSVRRGRILPGYASNAATTVTGKPTTLFYDPPWTLPFLRRNEVAVPVSAIGE